ncbi:MAG: hypothetical protein AVDCRST_MAG35-2078, partial [uncultured Quadrisphaera sp.]
DPAHARHPRRARARHRRHPARRSGGRAGHPGARAGHHVPARARSCGPCAGAARPPPGAGRLPRHRGRRRHLRHPARGGHRAARPCLLGRPAPGEPDGLPPPRDPRPGERHVGPARRPVGQRELGGRRAGHPRGAARRRPGPAGDRGHVVPARGGRGRL